MADTPPPASTKPDMGEEITDVPANTKPSTTTTPKTTTPAKPDRRAPSFNPGKSEERIVVVKEDEPETTAKTATKAPTKATSPKTKEPDAKKEVALNEDKSEIYHIVSAGETYFSIAKKYQVTVKDVLAWNNLTVDAKLKSGQKLLIRPVGQTIENANTKEEEFITHTVDIGENMFRIAQKYGVKMAQIKEWNDLTEDAVKEVKN